MIYFRMDKNIIAEIVGDKHADHWFDLEPTIYYKDDKPFGLMAFIDNPADFTRYIAATVKNIDQNFTISMLKDIIIQYEARPICLITDVASKQELIRRVLSRYDFEFHYKDNVMFSYGVNHGY